MTLRRKLLLAQLPLALGLLLIGGWARHTVATLDRASQDILKDNHLSVLAAQRMHAAAEAMARDVDAPAARADFERQLAFQEHNVTEPGEQAMTTELRGAWNRFAQQVDRRQSVDALLRELEGDTDRITAVNQDAMVGKSERARRSADAMSALLIAVTLAALVLGLLASAVLTSRLTRPLAVLSQAVRRLGEGDLQARIVMPGGDEISAVATELNTMATHLAGYRSSSLGDLLQAQHASQAAIDSLPDPVLMLDATGKVRDANRAALELLLVDPEAQDPWARVTPEVRALVEGAARRGAANPRGLEEAVLVGTREGARHYLLRAAVIEGDEGGLSLVWQDVTRLRRVDELKTDLVATVAHELRTPLTSLRMALHLCTENLVGELSGKQAELLFAAREDCDRLQSTVDELLDLSRISGGRVELHRRTVQLDALVSDVFAELRPDARDRGVTLVEEVSDVAVSADPDRLRLVLGNLVGNALRHTHPQGRVTVQAERVESELRLRVVDTGEGIPSDVLPRLFERFFRGPGAPPGGAGLGLYIVKELVEAHGGTIRATSTLGVGSTFAITLPMSGRDLPDRGAGTPADAG